MTKPTYEELEALIAIKDEALKTCISVDIGHPLGQKEQMFNEPLVTAALSATPQQVSEWEAKKQAQWNEESNSLIGQQDIEIETLREKLSALEANAQIEIDRLNAQILDRDKKLEERTEELLRIAGLNAANVGLLKAAEARIKASQEQDFVCTVLSPENHTVWWNDKYTDVSQAPKRDTKLYSAPVIPPELAELQRENAELNRCNDVLHGINSELRKLLEESKKTAMEFDAPRIRVVAKALGCEDSLPADDETLVGCIGTVMGVFRRKIEESKVPEVLLDGFAVYQQVKSDGRDSRTSGENVSDVLDAVVKIMRSQPKEPKQ